MSPGTINRRTLLTGAAAAAAGLALAGCSSDDSPSAAGTAGRKPGEKITLAFWSWVPGIDKAVDLWNSKNPDVQVKLEKVIAGSKGAYPKMFAALKAGNPPDLGQVEYQQIPAFLLEKGLVDLTQYGINDQAGKFVDWQWQQGSFGSGVYAVPQASGPMGMYYRTDRFKAWGVQPPTTWAEFETAARAIRKADPKSYICSFPPTSGGWFSAMAWQAGAKWFDVRGDDWVVTIDSPETRKVASYWEGLIRADLVKPEPDQQSGWFSEVQGGKIGCWVAAQWGDAILTGNAANTAGKWAVTQMPQWDKAKPSSSNWGGSSTAVLNGSKYPKEALEFAIWLNTDKASVDLLIQGGYGWPAAKDAFTGSALDKPSAFFGGAKYNEVFAKSDQLIDKSWKWIPTISDTYRHLGDAITAAIANKTSFADAIATVQKQTVADLQAKGLKVATG